MEDIAEELESDGEENEALSMDATNGEVSFKKEDNTEERKGPADDAGDETQSSFSVTGTDGRPRDLSAKPPRETAATEEEGPTCDREHYKRDGETLCMDAVAGDEIVLVARDRTARGVDSPKDDADKPVSGDNEWETACFIQEENGGALDTTMARLLADSYEFYLFVDEDNREMFAREGEKIRKDLQQRIISQNLSLIFDHETEEAHIEETERDCEEEMVDVTGIGPSTSASREDPEKEMDVTPGLKVKASGVDQTKGDGENEREREIDITPGIKVKASSVDQTKGDGDSEREREMDVTPDLTVIASGVEQATGDSESEREREETPKKARQDTEVQTEKGTGVDETRTGVADKPETEREGNQDKTVDIMAGCPQQSDLSLEGEEKVSITERSSERGRNNDTGDGYDSKGMEKDGGKTQICADRVVKINGCHSPEDDDTRNPIRRLCRASEARKR